MELCSFNLPDPSTLQASHDSLEERLTAGVGQESNLLHPSVTKDGHLDGHAGHESTNIHTEGKRTNGLREEHPSAEKDGSTRNSYSEEHEEEQISTDPQEDHAPSSRCLHHQEAIGVSSALLPSVKGEHNKLSNDSKNTMKTTFSGGVGEEQTPVRHQDTPDHHEGVRNIQEHRDEAKNVCSSQNNTTGPLPPPPNYGKITLS